MLQGHRLEHLVTVAVQPHLRAQPAAHRAGAQQLQVEVGKIVVLQQRVVAVKLADAGCHARHLGLQPHAEAAGAQAQAVTGQALLQRAGRQRGDGQHGSTR